MGGRKVVLGASRIAQGGSRCAPNISAFGLGESEIDGVVIKLGGSKIARGAIKHGVGSEIFRIGARRNAAR